MAEREVFPIQEEPEARTAKWYARNRPTQLPDKATQAATSSGGVQSHAMAW